MDIWFRWLLLYLALRFGNCMVVKEYRVDSICPEIYGTKLDTVSSVASPLGCAAVCQMDARCMTAFYYPSSRTCNPNLEAMNSSGDPNGCEPSSLVTYLSVLKHHCVNNTDCTSYSLETKCINGFCQCLMGYSLTPATGTCTEHCTRYGETFRLFPSTSLTGFNNGTFQGRNVLACKAQCLEAHFTCRTFQLNEDGECRVSAAYLTPQAGYVSDPDWTLAQRNCA